MYILVSVSKTVLCLLQMVFLVVSITPQGTVSVRESSEIVTIILFKTGYISVSVRYGGYVISSVIGISCCRLIPVLD